MRPAQLALARAEARLIERLEQLEAKMVQTQPSSPSTLAAGEERTWIEYGQLAAALAAIAPLTMPGAARAMTTEELATAFHLTPKTARRKGLKGELPVVPIRLGGDRGKIRWAAR
jgi:hypothetical protein